MMGQIWNVFAEELKPGAFHIIYRCPVTLISLHCAVTSKLLITEATHNLLQCEYAAHGTAIQHTHKQGNILSQINIAQTYNHLMSRSINNSQLDSDTRNTKW